MKLTHFATLFCAISSVSQAQGAFGVSAELKISSTAGGFSGVLSDLDTFGLGMAALGDLDGDGFQEIAVGAAGDDDGGTDRGAVWVLSLNTDGSVRSESKISDTAGGFLGVLDNMDLFGAELENLGDLDGDGRLELAVGATLDDDGGTDVGAVWILSLNGDGTVFSHQKISATSGGFTGAIGNFDTFGNGLRRLSDFDSDGIDELAVGVPLSDHGGFDKGAVFILFLNADGTVRSSQEISSIAGGFGGTLDNSDFFGRSMAWLGDLDGDGFGEMAVGTQQDDDGGTDRGAIWILSLNSDGTVRSESKISDTAGGFNGALDDGAAFGISLVWLGDNDGDGIGELAASANRLDRGGVTDQGGFWILSLDSAGLVVAEQEISSATSLSSSPDATDRFGTELSLLPNLRGTSTVELAASAINDDDGGTNRGAVYVLTIGQRATSTFRTAGSNPASLNIPAPAIGTTVIATVDLGGTTGHNLAVLVAYDSPTNVTLPGGQTLLVDLADPMGELLMLPPVTGPLATYSLPVPNNINMIGTPLYLQAAHVGGVTPFALSNAIDVVFGT